MQLWDTRTKKISPLIPLVPGKISMYACGLTPDGPMHLGHAATSIYNDVLVRYLMYKDYEVNFVQNITDIDDDILSKSKKAGKTWKEFGDFWTEKFLVDNKKLGVLKTDDFKKATDSIDTMIRIIVTLLKNRYAYESNGSIYCDIKSFPDYGQLSHFTEEVMLKIAAERGGHVDDKNKKHQLDFVLWQKSSDNEPSWDSPWDPPAHSGLSSGSKTGRGRPGWHIECSAMITEFLGERIDIHGGGKDLIFPHHESEIAQSEGASGKKPFVSRWFHTAMVMYEGEKMSKSLGNLILVSDLIKKYSANQIRYAVLTHHYRFPWEYDEAEMRALAKEWHTIERQLKRKTIAKTAITGEFESIMENDLCTTKALEVLKNGLEKETASTESIGKSFSVLGFSLSL